MGLKFWEMCCWPFVSTLPLRTIHYQKWASSSPTAILLSVIFHRKIKLFLAFFTRNLFETCTKNNWLFTAKGGRLSGSHPPTPTLIKRGPVSGRVHASHGWRAYFRHTMLGIPEPGEILFRFYGCMALGLWPTKKYYIRLDDINFFTIKSIINPYTCLLAHPFNTETKQAWNFSNKKAVIVHRYN